MRLWLRMLLGLTLVVGLAAPGWAAADLASMQPSEIELLQRRLTDAGCYAGATDGQASAALMLTVRACPDVSATAVSRDDICDVLFDLPGKKLLFLDACHSGAALNAGARGGTDIGAAVSDFSQTEGGVVAYAASTGREFSFEREEWGHGAFTKALIEGIGGKADLLHKGTITTGLLDVFLENRVRN